MSTRSHRSRPVRIFLILLWGLAGLVAHDGGHTAARGGGQKRSSSLHRKRGERAFSPGPTISR
jgi:hypothetical protein